VQLFAERGKALVNGVPTLMNGTRVRYRPVSTLVVESGDKREALVNPWRSLIVTKKLPDEVRKLDLHKLITEYEQKQKR
jgi:hypothetical protein